MIGLTPAQAKCKAIIETSLAEKGVAPSFQEMQDGLGVASKSRVYELINALEERGHIRRIHNRARALEIVGKPAPRCPPTPAELNRFSTPELLDLLAHVCGILGHRLGPAKIRETLDRIGARLAGAAS